jgi:serine protease Do
MKNTVGAGVLVAVVGVAAFGARAAAQAPPEAQRGAQEARDFMVLAGRGAEIGVHVTDRTDAGVVVEEVRPDSPAEKAGVKRSDVIVTFDGERVRSVRQFTRLVQETPPGRTVKATVVRDGQQRDVEITPREGRGALNGSFVYRDRLPDVRAFGDRLPYLDMLPRGMPFDFDLPGLMSAPRLGVDVDPLSDQLAEYFGAKQGVLVRSVTEGSAASRAGLKAGDVITSIDGEPVRSREDLVRALRVAKSEELTIGIVRDRRESNLKAKLEPPRRTSRRARPA